MSRQKSLFFVFLVLLSIIHYSPIKSTTLFKDSIVIQVDDEIENIDNRPRYIPSLEETQLAYQYQGYLGQIAPGETIVTMPGIAESWTKNENGTKWTFTIREGLTFHDGSPIDAKAVRYSIYADWMAYYQLDNMSAAVADHSHSVNVTYPEDDPKGNGNVVIFQGDWFPSPTFEFDVCGNWKIFALVPYGSHGLYSDTTQACQEKYNAFKEKPTSAGPYMLKERVEGEYVLLERFDDWYGWGQTFTASNGKNYTFPAVNQAFKYVKYRFISDIDLALTELKTGSVDIITGEFSTIDSLCQINNTEGYTANMLPVLGGASMHMNIQGNWPTIYGGPGNFPVSQTWFRKAVSHAINRTNIVNKTFQGLATERDSIFPDWVLDKYPNIDTSDYYDFDKGIAEAKSLLDNAGYSPLGFIDEPDNRFGWGLYANETEIDGVIQTKGRHFTLGTIDLDYNVKRALDLANELRKIGIYVDVLPLDLTQYPSPLRGTPGLAYNTSYIDKPDPDFEGPIWDLLLTTFGGNYETPWDFIAYQSFAYWMRYGYGSESWYNVNYEVAYAKATGGLPGFGYVPGTPNVSYPVPEWSNDDPQFIEGCEDAGYELSHELNSIPIVFYVFTCVINDHIQNFKASRNRMYTVAYLYSDINYSSNTSTVSQAITHTISKGFSVFVLLFTIITLVYLQKKK